MTATYNRKTKTVTIYEASGAFVEPQRCSSIAEARKIARGYGITTTAA